MRRAIVFSILVSVVVFLWVASAYAQDKGSPKSSSPARESEPVAAVEPAPAAEEREEIVFEKLRGLYFEGRAGAFFTVGGARGYSNGEPFVGFELGYDLSERFSAQFSYASGYQAANPLKYPEQCAEADCGAYHLDFGLTFFNLSCDYDLVYAERWALEARFGAGAVVIAPSAKPGQTPVDFDVLVGVRSEYYTLLRHFTVALEADFYYVLPTSIPALSIAFSILYNF